MSRISDLLLPSDERQVASPTHMKGREPLLGLAAAVLLMVAAVLDLVVTTGSGAPRHAEPLFPVIGLVLAVGLVGTLRFRNRLVSPITAVASAFFVTVAKAPTSLEGPHLVALAASLAFALICSTRQRREQKGLAPAGGRTSASRRGRSQPDEASVKRPPASRRYTPPKPGSSSR